MCLFSDLYNIENIKNTFIPIHKELNDFYKENQKLLLWEAVKNKQGSNIESLIKYKHDSVREFCKDPEMMKVLQNLISRHHFERYEYLFKKINFQKYSSVIIPSPVIPIFFKQELINDLERVIFDLITCKKLQKVIHNILEDSNLEQDIFGFQTIDKNDKSVIVGKFDNTFSSFRALAHELGHCLYEANHEYTSLYGSILSEFFALMFEQSLSEAFIVNNKMPLSLQKENRQYCEYLLKLDRLFYIKEISELIGNEENYFPIRKELLVFRPSYFTGTGMQIIYGESSFIFNSFKTIARYRNFNKVLSLFNSLLKINSESHSQTLVILKGLSH